MDTLHLVTTLALGFGALIMLVAIINVINLIKLLRESKFRNSWIILGVEMGLFFIGYIVFLYLLLNIKLSYIEVFASAIFLLVAMFIYMVASNGKFTINDLLSTSVSKTYLENIIKSMADTLIVVDTDDTSTIRTVNNAALNLLKYNETEIVGRSIEKVFDQNLVDKLNLDLLKKGIHISKFETSYLTKEGTKIPVLFSASPLQNRLGKTEGIIFVAQDITERKRAEEKIKSYLKRLEESEAQLKELNASKDKFFSIIAHDLRSPFTVLLGYSEIIAQDIEELSNQEIIEFAENLHKQSKIVFDLLENLLTWSRIQTGRIDFEPKKFDMCAVIQEVKQLYEESANHKHVTLEQLVNGEATVFADYNMIHTVLRNLISNALKFTPSNGKITISTESINGMLEISVSDTGVGIPEDVQKKLFRIDEHVTSLGTEHEKGTGLGLILCKELINKNGGEITLQSTVGEGTTFKFTIPLIHKK